MSAKRPVRSPFVVTLAAATAILAPACGARVDGVSTGDGGTKPDPIECPSSVPVAGSACSGELTCSYADYCGPVNAGTIARCSKGEWTVMTASCNPPPPDCPPSEPTVGSYCNYYYGPGCSYPDRCAPGSTKFYRCDGGTWQSSVVDLPVVCPTTPPAHGSSCADCAGRYPSSCVYEWCGDFPSRESICDPVTKTWSTRWASCNPPPPDAGPEFDAPWGEDAGTPTPDDPATP